MKKIQLSKETLRVLTEQETAQVGGGAGASLRDESCPSRPVIACGGGTTTTTNTTTNTTGGNTTGDTTGNTTGTTVGTGTGDCTRPATGCGGGTTHTGPV